MAAGSIGIGIVAAVLLVGPTTSPQPQPQPQSQAPANLAKGLVSEQDFGAAWQPSAGAEPEPPSFC